MTSTPSNLTVFISADMEGISGVTDNEFTTPGAADYGRARQLMTDDVNAAVEGARSAGATRILVNDSHGPMRNILIEGLHPAARLLSGSPKPLSMMEGILDPDTPPDEKAASSSSSPILHPSSLSSPWDMVFLVGYHARAGTPDAILDHTWTGVITGVWLNGVEVGEIGLNAALAGALGVPVALVTGDDKACAEARALLGDGVQTAVVKRAVGRYAADCLGLTEARDLIRRAAHDAVHEARPTPYAPTRPYHLKVGWAKTVYAEVAATVPGSRRMDGRHVEITLDDMVALYKTWRAFNSLAGTVG